LSLGLCTSLAVGCVDGDVEPADVTEAASPAPLTIVFGGALAGLSSAEQARFAAGQASFNEARGVADGLGPVFNDVSCGACHAVPAVGGFSPALETRFGRTINGVFDPLVSKGGSLLQVKGIGAAGACTFVGETVPAIANVVSGRLTQPTFGLGLVDEVDEPAFHAIAGYEAHVYPNEAGVVNIVHDIAHNRDAVGRFGWKAQVPTLHQFAGDAFLNEVGITNPEFPQENCPQGNCALLACNPRPGLNDNGDSVAKFTDFMRFLAPPPAVPLSPDAFKGQTLFRQVGCNHCHMETLRTGESEIAALSDVEFHPYSDFLLHDMGVLGDGIEQAHATGRFMRTAPLWGARVRTRFLHDGRATTIEQAIMAHAGQGQAARDAFAALSSADRAAVIAFVKSI
jgi:CxxC motif-containing protein (DUF1111 family)